MQDAASERPVVDRTAVYEAGKVGADLLPRPVDFVPEEGAHRAELGFDGLVVEFGGVQPTHERGRAELMARKMDGHTGHAAGTIAPDERGGCRAQASQGRCELPVLPEPDRPRRPSVLHGR